MADFGRFANVAPPVDHTGFLAALNRVGVAVMVLTGEFSGQGPRIAFADEGFLDLTGYTQEQLRGVTLNSLLVRELGSDELLRLKERLSGSSTWQATVTLRRSDGTPLRVEVQASSMFGCSSDQSPFVAVLRDHAQRQGVIGCLEDMQSTMDTVQSVISVGSWVAEFGDRRAMRFSPEMLSMFGLTAAELEQNPEAFFLRIHPDDRERLSRIVRVGMLERKGFDIQHRVVLPDGQVRWIHARGTVVTPSAGMPMRMVGIVFDITERVATRNSLSVAEQRYHAAAEASQDGLLLLAARRSADDAVEDFAVTDLNRRATEMLGGPRERLIGRTLREIAPNIRDWGHIAKCAHVLESGSSHQETTAGNSIGVGAKWIRWNAVPLVDGVAMSICDISWERDLSIQVAQASRLESIGSLAVGIAHDFNNMLAAIVGFGELASIALQPDTSARADVEQVMKAASRATELTRYLLAFGRRQPLEPQRVDINSSLNDLLPILTRLTGPGIEVATEFAEAATTLVDPSQFEQAVVNLVVNARDAMPDGGRLCIRTESVTLKDSDSECNRGCSPGSYVSVSVEDNGLGMDEHTRDRIFEPFFTTKGDQGGTGLGLASVYGFVKQSGGAILADSDLGRGTTVRLLLPLLLEARGRTPTPAPRISGSRLTGSATILVVEHDESVRSIARRILELHGYLVLEAESASDAEARLREHPQGCELLLIALRLPRANGLEFARRTKRERPNMTIVLMSGAADMNEIEDAAEQLGARFVQKPFTAGTLVGTIQEALGETTQWVEALDRSHEN